MRACLTVLVLASFGCGSEVLYFSGQGNDGVPPLPEACEACSSDEFCDQLGTDCGDWATCTPRPEGCTADCPGVCGCDGRVYCNACLARQAGTDVVPDAVCPAPADAHYAAALWHGALDHLVLMMADAGGAFCVRLLADAPSASAAVTVQIPGGWGVQGVIAYPGTADCLAWTTALSEPELAANAQGSISWPLSADAAYPCQLDVDLVARFPEPPSWLPPVVAMRATGIAVNSGCP